MPNFDDDKHPRDDKGRFTSGDMKSWAAAAKGRGATKSTEFGVQKTTSVAMVKGKRMRKERPTPVAHEKLEGYSKGGKGREGEIPKDAREVEVPLMGKNEEREFFSTGSRGTRSEPLRGGSYTPLIEIEENMRRRVDAVRKEREALVKDWFETKTKEMKIRDKSFLRTGETDANGKVIASGRWPKGEESFSKQKQKLKEAEEKSDVLAKKFKKLDDMHVCAHESEELLRKLWSRYGNSLRDDPGHLGSSDMSVEVNHSIKDGSVQMLFRGKSLSPDHPGEKELEITLTPPPDDSKKFTGLQKMPKTPGKTYGRGIVDFRGDQWEVNWDYKGRWDADQVTASVRATFPPEEHHASHAHPYTGEAKAMMYDGEIMGRKGQDGIRAADIVCNFFKDDHHTQPEYIAAKKSEEFDAQHPNGTGIETSRGGGKPGVLWKPSGKTLGDYKK